MKIDVDGGKVCVGHEDDERRTKMKKGRGEDRGAPLLSRVVNMAAKFTGFALPAPPSRDHGLARYHKVSRPCQLKLLGRRANVYGNEQSVGGRPHMKTRRCEASTSAETVLLR